MKKTQEWQLALLEYLLTPVYEIPPKSLCKKGLQEGYYQLVQSRAYQGTQYSIIPHGASIYYYDHESSQWTPGIVVDRVHDRNYIIVNERGRRVSRNRVDIKENKNVVQIRFEMPKLSSSSSPSSSTKVTPKPKSRPIVKPSHTPSHPKTSTETSFKTSSHSSSVLPKVITPGNNLQDKIHSLDHPSHISNCETGRYQPSVQLSQKNQ